VSTPNNPSGNAGGQQPSPPTNQTSAQAAGSIRERLSAPLPNERANTGGDERRSDISSSDFQQTDSRAQLRHGDERQRSTHPAPEPVDVQEPRETDVSPRAAKAAERKVAALFLLSLVGVVGFILWFSLADYRFGESGSVYFTPVLGVFLTLALVGVGAGAVMWAKLLMPDEEAVQERHPFGSPPDERAATAKALKQGLEQTGLPRRPLLITTLLLGAGSLALLPVPFLFSLGPSKGKERILGTTAWKPGMRLIRENGTFVRLGDLQIGGIESVFPDVEHGLLLSDTPALLIRMPPDQLELSGQAEEWAYQGHVVYSSVCTHLGCPVKLYEAQTHNLFCPCHQSTFDAAHGAKVIFGPAARPLPQLPIGVDEDGYFFALSDFPEPVGPSYWERNS
jgi:ubiquinol-cytochrome c reductase iron-sulfur subunit